MTCQPAALHFGNINVLTKAEKALTLSNDSPVNVNFRVALVISVFFYLIHEYCSGTIRVRMSGVFLQLSKIDDA